MVQLFDGGVVDQVGVVGVGVPLFRKRRPDEVKDRNTYKSYTFYTLYTSYTSYALPITHLSLYTYLQEITGYVHCNVVLKVQLSDLLLRQHKFEPYRCLLLKMFREDKSERKKQVANLIKCATIINYDSMGRGGQRARLLLQRSRFESC